MEYISWKGHPISPGRSGTEAQGVFLDMAK